MALDRPRYFQGQLLSATDLEDEQRYFLEKTRLLNRSLHGCGVASGLEVSLQEDRVQVAPGLALDCCGRMITVEEPLDIPVPEREGRDAVLYAVLLYEEELIKHQPALAADSCAPQLSEATRVRETHSTTWSECSPVAGHAREGTRWRACGKDHGVLLARFRWKGSGFVIEIEPL